MRNFILLLVLISGFLSGYLIGDYRGRDARESLKKAVETGNALATERETSIGRLKEELDTINDKRHRELETTRKDNVSKSAEWRRVKGNLDDRIKRTTAKLDESDTRLKTLISRRDGASASEKASLDLEIARLQKEREDLRREIDGSACLQARVPHSVSDALNDANIPGRK
jgi:chromosome segregation ATPase